MTSLYVNNITLHSKRVSYLTSIPISHEVRTPLAGIIGLSEHLADLNLNKEQKEFADSIQDTAKFLLSLVNDVLDFSKIESGHMDIEAIGFSPHKLVHDIFSVMNHQAMEKGLSLELYSNLASNKIVIGDPGRLRQILTNLISNSIKFTDEGSVRLTIESFVSNFATPPEERRMDFEQNHRKASMTDQMMNIRFMVKDTGVGIEPEAMINLFKPFSQADSSTARTYGGSGLGLAICRQLVGLMDGQIKLESTVGAGAVTTFEIPFYIYDRTHQNNEPSPGLHDGMSPFESNDTSSMDLTLQNPESQLIDIQYSDQKGASKSEDDQISNSNSTRQLHLQTVGQDALTQEERSKRHILVVEDNPVNRKIICLSVGKLGFSVSAVCNGQEALDYLAKSSSEPRPDAILMDCMMPQVDGYQATYQLRHDVDKFDEETRKIPIIALTASAIKGDREKCEAVGFSDYLKKPVVKDTLERSLLKWLAHKSTVSC
jgi:CheY-like chemotaxis protein/nitrogen-specific signal transduction histidine kinase